MLKKCYTCKEEKDVKAFSKDSRNKDGLHYYCRKCRAKHRKDHKEEAAAYHKQYREEHKEELAASKKQYYEDHKEELAIKSKQYYEEHKEEQATYLKQWWKNNPEKRITYENNRRARKNGNGGTHTAQEWAELKERHDFTCPCCKRKEPDIKLTRDHIIPIVKGGTNFIDNVQPLCGSCNSSKNDKIIDYREQFEAEIA